MTFSEEKEISVGVHNVQADRSILSCELIEASEKGMLKENLKKFIPELEEDSNPILHDIELQITASCGD